MGKLVSLLQAWGFTEFIFNFFYFMKICWGYEPQYDEFGYNSGQNILELKAFNTVLIHHK